MSLTARPVGGSPPAAMRVRHLASLKEPQELYLERRVASGSTWLLELDGNPVGYAVIDAGGTLVELFHDDPLVPEPVGLFGQLSRSAGVEACLYQSFDLRMTMRAAAIEARTEPAAILFRTILDAGHVARLDASMRPATQADVGEIAKIDEGFFADWDEIRRYLDMGGLSVLESSANGIIGCGVAEPVMANGTDIDIGMMVAPDFRRRGFGAFIASHLKSQVVSKGLRPICGCAIDNIGSQRALVQAGFVPDHRLLRFKL